jgi:hypothetical protein
VTRPSCVFCGRTIADGVALHRLNPAGWACDEHKGKPISTLNLLLHERDQLRAALARLHAWALAQEKGDCMYSGDHPLAQAAAVLAPAGVGVPRG